jgi:hypothetical protein
MAANNSRKEKEETTSSAKLIGQEEVLFRDLFEYILWPIIHPLVATIPFDHYKTCKEESYTLLKKQLQDQNSSTEGFLHNKIIDESLEPKVIDFIKNLIEEFSQSFRDEIAEAKESMKVIEGIKKLIRQQLVLLWVEEFINTTITSFIVFPLKSPEAILKLKKLLTRIFIAIIKEEISPEEGKKQVTSILNSYQNELSKEVIFFIKSFVEIMSDLYKSFSLEGIAQFQKTMFNDQYFYTEELPRTISKGALISKALDEPIKNQEKMLQEWEKLVLKPATIGLQIWGLEAYEEFNKKCREAFKLFINQALTADSFAARVEQAFSDLEVEDKLDVNEENNHLLPIKQAIISSVKVLEETRADDPDFSFLIFLIEEERAEARKSYL